MALTFFWRCEGTTLGAPDDYSSGDTTATATGAVSIDATAAKVGSNGVKTVDATDYYEFDATSILIVDQGAMGCWVQGPSALSGSGQPRGIFTRSTGSANDAIDLQQSGPNNVRLTIKANGGSNLNLLTSGAGIVAGSWYFLIGRWHLSADKRKIEVYDSAMSLITSTEDLVTDLAPATPASINLIRIGNASSDLAVQWVDNVMFGDTYAEPLQNYALYTSYTQVTGGAKGRMLMMGVG